MLDPDNRSPEPRLVFRPEKLRQLGIPDARSVHMEKLIEYMKSKPGVWLATALQIADYVKKNEPPQQVGGRSTGSRTVGGNPRRPSLFLFDKPRTARPGTFMRRAPSPVSIRSDRLQRGYAQ